MASSCACSCDCLIALCLNVDSGSAARLNVLYMFLMKHVPSWKSVTEAGAAAFINTNVISSVRGGKKIEYPSMKLQIIKQRYKRKSF